MPLFAALNRAAGTVLTVSTGGSTTGLATYLRLLLEGCIESGALFVACTSPKSREFDGVALWGPPCDDWLPWCAFPASRFLLSMVLTSNFPGKMKNSYQNCDKKRGTG